MNRDDYYHDYGYDEYSYRPDDDQPHIDNQNVVSQYVRQVSQIAPRAEQFVTEISGNNNLLVLMFILICIIALLQALQIRQLHNIISQAIGAQK